MTASRDPATEVIPVWFDPPPRAHDWDLVPPSGQCNQPIGHTVAGITITHYCRRVLDAAGGHEGECAPLDTQGRNVLTDPAYVVPVDVLTDPIEFVSGDENKES